jgi:hypothetical protein
LGVLTSEDGEARGFPGAPPTLNIVIQRDQISDYARRIHYDFFKQHPELP